MNITFGIAISEDGTARTSRNFVNKQAFSNWANKQFIKNHSLTIHEYEMNTETYDIKQVGTWHE